MNDIVIKASTFKKTAYLLILLVLVGIIFYQNYKGPIFQNAISGLSASIDNRAAEKPEEKAVEVKEEEPVKEEIKVEPEVKNETKAESDANLNLAGTFTFTINEINYEKRGGNGSIEYGKISSIKYTIDNQLKDVTPKLVFCGVYDSNTDEDDQNKKCDDTDDKYRATILPLIKAGKRVTLTTNVITSEISLNFIDFELEKTMNVQLKDSADGGSLANATKTFTVS